QALAAGRRDVVRATPDMHLLLAPPGAGVVLVEAGKIAVVALVQRLVADGFEAALTDAVEDDGAGLLRPDERRGEGDVEAEPARLQPLAGGGRLRLPLFGQADVAPPGEQVLQVPFALAVAHE